jgi:hypothetical protein
MAKHLSDEDIKKIVEHLDEWELSTKVTWDKLCNSLDEKLGISHTRQTLQKHERIKDAFDGLKKHIRGKRPHGKKVLPSSLAAASKQIESLKRKNERLERENANLLQQFQVWQYNAHVHGIMQEQLSQPLPDKVNN